jgi:hypothetical protein
MTASHFIKKDVNVMSENEFVNRIEAIDGSQDTVPEAIESADRLPADKEHFDSLMQNDAQAKAAGIKASDKTVSLIDTVRDLNYMPNSPGQVSHDKLVIQTKEAIAKIDEIKQTLESPDVNIKNSSRPLLQNKLTHINESLQVALSRVGLEIDPTAAVAAPSKASLANPIERFLGFLTDGQGKLQALGGELSQMGAKNQELSAVNMLAIQVKVGQIQQELELFSNLLNKALESIKTIMNIQV